MNCQNTLTSQRGFTALELIIVLIIGFSIIILSSSKLGELFTASRVNKTIDHILGIKTAIYEIKTSDGYGSDNLAETIIAAELTPKSITLTNGIMKNAWDEDIEITGNNETALISLGKMPKSACVKILKSILPDSSFQKIEGNSTELNRESRNNDIITACSEEGGTSLQLTVK